MKRLFFLIVLLFTSLNVLVTNAQRLYNVSWNTLSGVTESEDVIANTTSSAGYSVSGNQAASGETGYLEFSNFQIDKTKSIGIIVDGNTGAIDHCFSFVNNTVSIYNGSTLKIAAYIFSKGDKFKISFSGTTMQFYHNGILKTSYSFTNIILRIKIILSSQNSSFSGIKTSMGLPYTLSRPTSMNYVQTISPLQAVSSITSSGEQRKTGDYLEKIAYYDGLGRQIQTVGVAQSPMLRDEVQPMYYDNLGRKTREYLPYTVKTSSSGTYQSSAINTSTGDPVNQKTYMQSYYNANNDYQYAYIDNNYESSSLNRVVETVGIGADWKGKLADAKKKSFKYDYGTNNEGIMFVAVNDAVSPIKFYLENEYFVGTLIRTTITDENGNKSDEFKDKAGRLILKRSYIGSKTFSTYYVYDNLGSLRLIIQPKGVATLETSFTTLNYNQQYYIPDNIINTNCFLYEYDARDRMIAKLVPGQTVKLSGESKGAVFMVYNKKDQLILSQDGNLANQNKWKFTKYDVYGRPIMTGIYSPGVAISQVTMQSNVDNSTLGQYENRISTSYGYTTDQTYPNANLDVETVTCYDDYNYPGVSYSYATKIGFANIPTSRVDDKVTAQKVKALGTSTWLTTVNYYDEYGRTIQVKQNNYLSGSNVITNDYTFTNNISKVLTENTVTLSGENTKNYSLQKRYVYDNSDRVIDAFEKINSETEIQLSRVAYSEIGSVKEKNLHIISSKPALQSVDYSYNIRGWLTGINNTDLNDGEGDIFGMKLMYNDLGSYTSGSKQYNGNVSAWEWYGSWTNPTNASDAYTGKHAYTYQYDGLNRLLSAQYYRNIGRNTGFDFATTYDDNGNIKTMQQSATGYGQIDNLTYSYDNSEMDNRLRAVGDAATDVTNRGDFTEIATYEGTSSTEYSYDDNGNMLEDKNRNIKIQYNELNLPSLVTIGANTISYLYDANGSKLKKTVTNSGTITNTYYIGEFVYSDNDLLYGLTSDGRFVKDGTTHRYEYFMKDHLGNTRMTFTDLGADGTVDKIQENSYYPYGLKMPGFTSLSSGYTGNKLLFNGKENQDDIAGFGFVDYGARLLDPALGKWPSIDPLTEKVTDVTPYRFAMNNPVRVFDKDGLDDFFDFNGNLIKTTPYGNEIHMVNSSQAVFNNMYNVAMDRINKKEYNWNQANNYLSTFSTDFNDISVKNNSKALTGIIWHYYLSSGYDPKLVSAFGLIELSDCGCTAWSYGPPETYQFAYENDRILSFVQNYNDIKSLWNHEYFHRNLQVGGTNDNTPEGRANHLNAYWSEVTNEIFKNTSPNFREHTIANVADYLSSINKDDLYYWKPLFEQAFGGQFILNNNVYEFKQYGN